MSYERRVYESADNNILSYALSQTDRKKVLGLSFKIYAHHLSN